MKRVLSGLETWPSASPGPQSRSMGFPWRKKSSQKFPDPYWMSRTPEILGTMQVPHIRARFLIMCPSSSEVQQPIHSHEFADREIFLTKIISLIKLFCRGTYSREFYPAPSRRDRIHSTTWSPQGITSFVGSWVGFCRMGGMIDRREWIG